MARKAAPKRTTATKKKSRRQEKSTRKTHSCQKDRACQEKFFCGRVKNDQNAGSYRNCGKNKSKSKASKRGAGRIRNSDRTSYQEASDR